MFQRMAFTLLALIAAAAPASENEQPWEALRAGGQVVLMRHAQTVPGFGDPDGFRVLGRLEPDRIISGQTGTR